MALREIEQSGVPPALATILVAHNRDSRVAQHYLETHPH
jgi:hypothetical protein